MDGMDGWMDGWVDGWMDGWMDGGWIGTTGAMDGWLNGWMDGWMYGWIDGWIDGWMDVWTWMVHGWIESSLLLVFIGFNDKSLNWWIRFHGHVLFNDNTPSVISRFSLIPISFENASRTKVCTRASFFMTILDLG